MRKSKIIFARNWSGGSSLASLTRDLVIGQYEFCYPEAVAWAKGMPREKSIDDIEFVPDDRVYYFRRSDVLIKFVKKNNKLLHGNTDLLIQVREPIDWLLAEYFGNTFTHSSPVGEEKLWNQRRRENIRAGPFQYCLERAPQLESEFKEINAISGAVSPRYLPYNDFVCDIGSYIERYLDLLEISIGGARKEKLIAAYDVVDLLKAGRAGNATLKVMKRNLSPYEWPFPGRSQLVFDQESLAQLTEKTPSVLQLSDDINPAVRNKPDPPDFQKALSPMKTWGRYFYRFHMREPLAKKMSKFKARLKNHTR